MLAAVLAGAGVYGMLARRNLVLVLVGAELLLTAAGIILVLASTLPGADATGQVATIMLITIAAAEVGLALAIVLALYRARSTSDLTRQDER